MIYFGEKTMHIHITVKPVSNNGHLREPENMAFMSSCLLNTG